MPNRPEFIPYDSAYTLSTAQAFLEVFTTPPLNEVLSLNDTLSQLESDSRHHGFDGILVCIAEEVVGFSWWFDITGPELHDRWRPRFDPKENIPEPDGHGVYLAEFGVVPRLQNHGLGQRLLVNTLNQIEPDHDWIALTMQNYVHAGLALLKSRAFTKLDLVGIQVPSNICLMKTLWH